VRLRAAPPYQACSWYSVDLWRNIRRLARNIRGSQHRQKRFDNSLKHRSPSNSFHFADVMSYVHRTTLDRVRAPRFPGRPQKARQGELAWHFKVVCSEQNSNSSRQSCSEALSSSKRCHQATVSVQHAGPSGESRCCRTQHLAASQVTLVTRSLRYRLVHRASLRQPLWQDRQDRQAQNGVQLTLLPFPPLMGFLQSTSSCQVLCLQVCFSSILCFERSAQLR